MMDVLFQVVAVLACMAIIWRVDAITNRMNGSCRFPVRASFIILAGGAAFTILGVLRGLVPPPSMVMMAIGVAVFLIAERRIQILLRLHGTFPIERRAKS